MSVHEIYITSEPQRQKAMHWLNNARLGFFVRFQRNKRTNEQNARMWAMLNDISEQYIFNGTRFSATDWKDIFMHALGHEIRMLPGLQGGYFPAGRRTSRLSREAFSDLIELIQKLGAENNIEFTDTQTTATRDQADHT